MISFVVPAYNEEAFIADTLNAIHFSARVVGEQYEIVVADDEVAAGTVEPENPNNSKPANTAWDPLGPPQRFRKALFPCVRLARRSASAENGGKILGGI
jgi:cellulose synthase/poly-beta-1,6-N-acetylglucosamine synthase-like glycosyltransferase